MSNTYTDSWFEIFLQSIDPLQTEKETAFLARQLPPPAQTTVLEVCCGEGRHAHALAEVGYYVTGIDKNRKAIANARRKGIRENVSFYEHDMRRLYALPQTYDAVLCLWQSFGFFDETTNLAILKQMAQKLNVSGVLILDIYHRGFFETQTNLGERIFEKNGQLIKETKKMAGNRLVTEIEYQSSGETDQFEWQLYYPEEISALAETAGLASVLQCSGFNERTPASADAPRMQLVFKKEGNLRKLIRQ